MRVWLTKWWRQVTVGCLVVPAVVLGFSALYEPRTGVFDISAALTALYLTLSMFTLNVVGPDPAPWSLQFARLFAAAASSSALILAFFSLLRGNPDVARARKRRDHVVIVGTGPEALRLANQHANQGDRPVWVGEIDAADIETARGRGVTLPVPPRTRCSGRSSTARSPWSSQLQATPRRCGSPGRSAAPRTNAPISY